MTARSDIGHAELIGERALELAALPGRAGSILAVVSKAVYLRSGNEIIWLGQAAGANGGSGLPAHSRGILGRFDLSAMAVGMPFEVGEASLLFSGRYSLELGSASAWLPPTIGRPARPEIAYQRFLGLFDEIQPLGPGPGLGQAIPLIFEIARGGDPALPFATDPFAAAALPHVRELARACRRRDLARILDVTPALLGMGAGLTPAGDDFLGGLFFVLHHLGQAYPGRFSTLALPLDDLLAGARLRTNLVSHTLLADHVRGGGAEPLHALAVSLLSANGSEERKAIVGRLVEIGSTSGWDLLAGALTGMLMTP